MATNNASDQPNFNWMVVPPTLQTFTPTTGQTITVSTSVASSVFVQIVPAGLLAALTVALPAGSYVGQRVHISSSQAITSVTINSASGNVLGALTSWLINGFSSYYWDGTNWNRIG